MYIKLVRNFFFLSILTPCLAWGLTFSNGKVVEEGQLEKTAEVEIKSSVKTETYTITKPGLLFIPIDELIANVANSDDTLISDCDRYSMVAISKNFSKGFKPSRKNDTTWSIEDDLTGPLTYFYCGYISGIANEMNDKFISSRVKMIRDFFTNLSESNYLNSFPKQGDDTQHAYDTSKPIIPLLFIYSHFQNEFSEDEKIKIKKMFLDLEAKNRYTFNQSQVGIGSTYNNHGMYVNNYRLLSSILFNDNKMFNESINFFLQQMKYNETESGLFKIDSKRGTCALHYNLHNLPPLLSILWNLKLQGIDLSDTKLNSKDTISDIVSVIIDAVENPQIVMDQNKKVGYASSFAQVSCYKWMNNDEKKSYLTKFNNKDLILPYTSSYWINSFVALTNNKSVYDKFLKSELLTNQFFYQGADEEAFVGIFSKYIK